MEAVIMKTEEEAKMVQDKLIKGLKHEDLAEVSAADVDSGKLGILKNIVTGQGMERILMNRQGESCARLTGRLVTSVRVLVTLTRCAKVGRRMSRATPLP